MMIPTLECPMYSQTCGFDENKELSARIGIILPHTKCIEFLNIEGWVATYKGASESIKNKLLDIYKNNQVVIHKKILALIG
jgi:hypothetical protein